MKIPGARVWCAAVLAAICLMALVPALAQGRAECATVKSTVLERPVRYCAYLPASFDTDKARRFPVVYYLHGLGDNEQSLLNMGGWDLIEELRRTAKLGDLRKSRVMFPEYFSCPIEKTFTRLGHDHAARRPRKQRQPDLVLELTDLHRNCCLRYIYTPGTGRKGLCLRNCQKSLKLSDLHIIPR